MPSAPNHRTVRHTSVELIVWARGEKIRSCVHFGSCLEVSFGRRGFSICPSRPPSPIDPVPIDVYQFDPRTRTAGKAFKKLIASLSFPVKRTIRLPARSELAIRVNAISGCGGRMPATSTGTCCITCNGVKACGCKVEMDCGSCCVGECC